MGTGVGEGVGEGVGLGSAVACAPGEEAGVAGGAGEDVEAGAGVGVCARSEAELTAMQPAASAMLRMRRTLTLRRQAILATLRLTADASNVL